MKFNSIFYFFLLIITITICGCDNTPKGFCLQEGDFLFQDLDGGSLSDAIEDVTAKKRCLSFSHVGIAVAGDDQKIIILEAIDNGVQYTSLDKFLSRSLTDYGLPKVCVARLTNQDETRIKRAVAYGRGLIGLPYDSTYTMSDSAYYCSKLIYEMFKHSGDGSDIFKLSPMTFKDNKTGKFHSTWIEHYRELGVQIPEGELGCNPNDMSQSEKIDWVFDYSK